MPRPQGSAIVLRPATAADLSLLAHWDEQPHIIAADPNDDWEWAVELNRDPDWREQLIAEVDGRPIGFIQIIDPAREDSHYWGDVPANLRAIDIWIGEESDLGKGYGTRMMQLALARCLADSAVTAVLIDPLVSNTRAHRFYERLGFQFVEHRRFGDDDCCVYRLSREDWFGVRLVTSDTIDPLSISSTYVVLGEKGDAIPVAVSDRVFEDLASKFGDFRGKRLVSHFSFDQDWDCWEMHPAGEELVCLLSGQADLILEQDGVEKTVPLRTTGAYALVPRGTWHTAKVYVPCSMLFITPGEGTQHRLL